jgi:hypothetical protein
MRSSPFKVVVAYFLAWGSTADRWETWTAFTASWPSELPPDQMKMSLPTKKQFVLAARRLLFLRRLTVPWSLCIKQPK